MKMAQEVKRPSDKSNNLSSIFLSHMMKEPTITANSLSLSSIPGLYTMKNRSTHASCPLTSACASWHTNTQVNRNNILSTERMPWYAETIRKHNWLRTNSTLTTAQHWTWSKALAANKSGLPISCKTCLHLAGFQSLREEGRSPCNRNLTFTCVNTTAQRTGPT